MKSKFYICFVCLFYAVSFFAGRVGATDNKNTPKPFTFEIKTDKTEFQVGEEIEGKVSISNEFPATLPGVFIVKLFHDGKYVSEIATSVPAIPMGTTDFSLHNFSVPGFNATEASLGDWRISVGQQNQDPDFAKSVTVRIVPREIQGKD